MVNVIQVLGLRRDANRAAPRRTGSGRQTTKRPFVLSLRGPRFGAPATSYAAASKSAAASSSSDAQQDDEQQQQQRTPHVQSGAPAAAAAAGASSSIAPLPIEWDDEAMLPADFGAPAEAGTSTAVDRHSMGTSPINFPAPPSRLSMGTSPTVPDALAPPPPPPAADDDDGDGDMGDMGGFDDDDGGMGMGMDDAEGDDAPGSGSGAAAGEQQAAAADPQPRPPRAKGASKKRKISCGPMPNAPEEGDAAVLPNRGGRSQRQRFRPLEFWRGERVIYVNPEERSKATGRRASAKFESVVDVQVAERESTPNWVRARRRAAEKKSSKLAAPGADLLAGARDHTAEDAADDDDAAAAAAAAKPKRQKKRANKDTSAK